MSFSLNPTAESFVPSDKPTERRGSFKLNPRATEFTPGCPVADPVTQVGYYDEMPVPETTYGNEGMYPLPCQPIRPLGGGHVPTDFNDYVPVTPVMQIAPDVQVQPIPEKLKRPAWVDVARQSYANKQQQDAAAAALAEKGESTKTAETEGGAENSDEKESVSEPKNFAFNANAKTFNFAPQPTSYPAMIVNAPYIIPHKSNPNNMGQGHLPHVAASAHVDHRGSMNRDRRMQTTKRHNDNRHDKNGMRHQNVHDHRSDNTMQSHKNDHQYHKRDYQNRNSSDNSRHYQNYHGAHYNAHTAHHHMQYTEQPLQHHAVQHTVQPVVNDAKADNVKAIEKGPAPDVPTAEVVAEKKIEEGEAEKKTEEDVKPKLSWADIARAPKPKPKEPAPAMTSIAASATSTNVNTNASVKVAPLTASGETSPQANAPESPHAKASEAPKKAPTETPKANTAEAPQVKAAEAPKAKAAEPKVKAVEPSTAKAAEPSKATAVELTKTKAIAPKAKAAGPRAPPKVPAVVAPVETKWGPKKKEEPVEKVEEKTIPVNKPAEKTVEKTVEKPVEKVVDKPVEKPAAKATSGAQQDVKKPEDKKEVSATATQAAPVPTLADFPAFPGTPKASSKAVGATPAPVAESTSAAPSWAARARKVSEAPVPKRMPVPKAKAVAAPSVDDKAADAVSEEKKADAVSDDKTADVVSKENVSVVDEKKVDIADDKDTAIADMPTHVAVKEKKDVVITENNEALATAKTKVGAEEKKKGTVKKKEVVEEKMTDVVVEDKIVDEKNEIPSEEKQIVPEQKQEMLVEDKQEAEDEWKEVTAPKRKKNAAEKKTDTIIEEKKIVAEEKKVTEKTIIAEEKKVIAKETTQVSVEEEKDIVEQVSKIIAEKEKTIVEEEKTIVEEEKTVVDEEKTIVEMEKEDLGANKEVIPEEKTEGIEEETTRATEENKRDFFATEKKKSGAENRKGGTVKRKKASDRKKTSLAVATNTCVEENKKNVGDTEKHEDKKNLSEARETEKPLAVLAAEKEEEEVSSSSTVEPEEKTVEKPVGKAVEIVRDGWSDDEDEKRAESATRDHLRRKEALEEGSSPYTASPSTNDDLSEDSDVQSGTIKFARSFLMSLRNEGASLAVCPGGVPECIRIGYEDKNAKTKRTSKSARTEPMPKLVASQNSWGTMQTSKGDLDEESKFHRTIKSLLNKLTIEKYDKLLPQLLESGFTCEQRIVLLMEEVFEKATTQHHFIEMYTNLCVDLNKHLVENNICQGEGSFRKVLLGQCQQAFQANMEPLEKSEDDDSLEARHKRKMRMLGNMKFIGQLFIRQMLRKGIMFSCTTDLLATCTEESIETLCTFLMEVGPQFDDASKYPDLARDFDKVFDQMASLCKDKVKTKDFQASTRTKCLIKDVLDMRKKNWLGKTIKQQPEAPALLAEIKKVWADDNKVPTSQISDVSADTEWATQRKKSSTKPTLKPSFVSQPSNVMSKSSSKSFSTVPMGRSSTGNLSRKKDEAPTSLSHDIFAPRNDTAPSGLTASLSLSGVGCLRPGGRSLFPDRVRKSATTAVEEIKETSPVQPKAEIAPAITERKSTPSSGSSDGIRRYSRSSIKRIGESVISGPLDSVPEVIQRRSTDFTRRSTADLIDRRSTLASPAPSDENEGEDNWRRSSSGVMRAERKEKKKKKEEKEAPMQLSEPSKSSWSRRTKEMSEDDKFLGKMKSILNKLTIEKYESLYMQLQDLGFKKVSQIKALVDDLFSKATTQHHFIGMYTKLCVRFNNWWKERGQDGCELDVDDEDLAGLAGGEHFRRVLLNKCQEVFGDMNKTPEGLDLIEDEDDRAEALLKIKERMLGNAKFIGELLVQKVVKVRILFYCSQTLLEIKTPASLEALSAMMHVVGPEFDMSDFRYKSKMDDIFVKIEKVVADSKVDTRTKTLLRNVVDRRSDKWARNKLEVAGPQSLNQVKREWAGDHKVQLKSEQLKKPEPEPGAEEEWEEVKVKRVTGNNRPRREMSGEEFALKKKSTKKF